MLTSTGPTICAHCGRPIINDMVTAAGGYAYHFWCTRSPHEPKIADIDLPKRENQDEKFKFSTGVIKLDKEAP